MKYAGMPAAMWTLFAGSFRKQLTAILGYDETAAREMIRKAKPKYKELIARLPEFEKADRFKMNIVNCAMLSAIILSMPQRPEVGPLTDFLRKIHVHGPGPLGLPQERQAPIYGEARGGPESHGRPESGGPESLFLEYGVLRLPGRQRLRSPVQQMRHLHAYAGIGPCRPDPGHVPLRLYHERIGRNHGFCAGIHPGLRGTLLRLRVQTEKIKSIFLHRRKNWGKPPAFPAVLCYDRETKARWGVCPGRMYG